MTEQAPALPLKPPSLVNQAIALIVRHAAGGWAIWLAGHGLLDKTDQTAFADAMSGSLMLLVVLLWSLASKALANMDWFAALQAPAPGSPVTVTHTVGDVSQTIGAPTPAQAAATLEAIRSATPPAGL